MLAKITKSRELKAGLLFAAITSGLLITSGLAMASENSNPPSEEFTNRDMLQAVAALHHIDEESAVSRLARETDAAVVLYSIERLGIESYAGSWFNPDSMKLVVAISNPEDASRLENFGVETVIVDRSLRDLKALEQKATDLYELFGLPKEQFASARIDVRTNQLIVSVHESIAGDTGIALNYMDDNGVIQVESLDLMPSLSTGSLSVAVGTRNLDWAIDPGGVWPCSVGAATTDGYVTAGHCGEDGNDMGDSSGAALGEVQGSTWFDSNPSLDSAHVDTVAGWTPVAKVYGYTDGIFNVSALWGSLLEYPIGTTVCRYGQTSGGPHCGVIDARNVSVSFGSHTVTGLTQLAGSCSDDGDSGGPHVAGAGVIQGTNTGTQRYGQYDSCPTQSRYTWFQPLIDTVNTYSSAGVEVLTSHGANKPSFGGVECPSTSLGGPGFYQCMFASVYSQGKVTSIQWTTSTGASSSFPIVSDSCTTGQWISVVLKATNGYGTRTNNYSFTCP